MPLLQRQTPLIQHHSDNDIKGDIKGHLFLSIESQKRYKTDNY